ncbi:hypothetical protein AB0D49_33085 [Streptomyces sp. NPDC048290]|uniref:hypothetical protein n=1 Tax=Streptomyces sp. NPDC048290 TaxID=3155811 RepID=UPI00341993B5
MTRPDDDVVRLAVVGLRRELPKRRGSGSDDESGRGPETVTAPTGDQRVPKPLPWGTRMRAGLTARKAEPDE